MIKLLVKSPDQNIFEDKGLIIKEIIISTQSGIIGIRDGHENMISAIPDGEMTIVFNNNTSNTINDNNSDLNKDEILDSIIYSISTGIIKIDNVNENGINITNVDILLQEAHNVKDLDIAELEKAIERAKTATLEKDQDDIYFSEQLLRDLNKIKIAKKYR